MSDNDSSSNEEMEKTSDVEEIEEDLRPIGRFRYSFDVAPMSFDTVRTDYSGWFNDRRSAEHSCYQGCAKVENEIVVPSEPPLQLPADIISPVAATVAGQRRSIDKLVIQPQSMGERLSFINEEADHMDDMEVDNVDRVENIDLDNNDKVESDGDIDNRKFDGDVRYLDIEVDEDDNGEDPDVDKENIDSSMESPVLRLRVTDYPMTAINRSKKATLDRQIPGTIRQIPGTSRQIPGTSRQIPGTSRKIPGTGRQIPGASRQIPGTNRQIPGTGRQIPGASRQIPGTSRQIPGTSRQIPGTSRQIPGTSRQIPGTSRQMPGTSRQIPATIGAIHDGACTLPRFGRTAQEAPTLQLGASTMNRKKPLQPLGGMNNNALFREKNKWSKPPTKPISPNLATKKRAEEKAAKQNQEDQAATQPPGRHNNAPQGPNRGGRNPRGAGGSSGSKSMGQTKQSRL